MTLASTLRSIIIVSLTFTANLCSTNALLSCNSSTQKEKTEAVTTQKIRLINLPAPTPLLKTETDRIKLACQCLPKSQAVLTIFMVELLWQKMGI